MSEYRGKVKFFDYAKGSGLVEGSDETDGADVFFHVSQFTRGEPDIIDAGDDITVNVTSTKKGLQASEIISFRGVAQ